MTGPKVQGTYEYDDDGLHITTDSGQEIDIPGDGADRCAENLDISEGEGEFEVSETEWNDLARGSFR